MSTTPNCGITNIDPTLSPIPQINDALRVIDALLQGAVIDFEDDPPVTPADGDQYIVGTGTGAWVGEDDNLAQWVDEGAFWQFYEAGTQVRLVLNLADGGLYAHGAGWTLVGGLPDAPSDGTTYGRQNAAWVPAGGGTPGGSDKQVQFNNTGAFGGEAGFEYDATTNTLTVSNITTAGLLMTAASATGGAGFRVPHGAAPTTPTNGDVWTTSAGMYVRINGVTVGPLAASGGGVAWGEITGTLSAQTDLQAALDAKAGLNVPQNSQSAAYTLVLSDAGKHILHPSADTTARIFTIPANSSVAFPVGTVVTFVNQNAGGVITVEITTDTMRLAGAGTTGSRTLAANGIATAIKVTSTEWLINGTGLS